MKNPPHIYKNWLKKCKIEVLQYTKEIYIGIVPHKDIQYKTSHYSMRANTSPSTFLAIQTLLICALKLVGLTNIKRSVLKCCCARDLEREIEMN